MSEEWTQDDLIAQYRCAQAEALSKALTGDLATARKDGPSDRNEDAHIVLVLGLAAEGWVALASVGEKTIWRITSAGRAEIERREGEG